MDFTREPIIETVITPKEGCKLVVRSSKSNGQEEHFVDAVEVVSFGHSFFFRSSERPKTFLVPATDYEILEVREARMVLKNVGLDRTIKIAGGREGQMRSNREHHVEKVEQLPEESPSEDTVQPPSSQERPQEGRLDKKRDRRRNYRRKRGRDGGPEEEGYEAEGNKVDTPEQRKTVEGETPLSQQVQTTSVLTSLLPPPPTLISETIAHYKDKFKEAFYSKEERGPKGEDTPTIPQPEYGSFELSEEEEEEIYLQRKRQSDKDDESDLPHLHHGNHESEPQP